MLHWVKGTGGQVHAGLSYCTLACGYGLSIDTMRLEPRLWRGHKARGGNYRTFEPFSAQVRQFVSKL